MGILGWILFGLIAGVIAKLIMPGRDPGGFIVTILLGIAGAVIGGFVGRAMGFYGEGEAAVHALRGVSLQIEPGALPPGAPGVAVRAGLRLADLVPGAQVVGAASPPFRSRTVLVFVVSVGSIVSNWVARGLHALG